uniref:hypothetical protein n=1 Tax=Goniotrichopsis reniformis TaxID=468933 RepID=UPI001FCDE25E|nr:hypothetical protein MW428_pgp044 [Goniotrichopsis reniformis]UNJ14854.1 hypothetical protein [Goniotrichopsis reniformis]
MIPLYSFQISELYAPSLLDQIPLLFRILIFSDGSLTRHLQIILGDYINIELENTALAQLNDYHGNLLYTKIDYPQISRQIWLVTEKNGKVVYANSIWNENILRKYFKDPNIPIGNWLIESELDIFRKIYKVEYVHYYDLEKHFGYKGPFWSRYYFLIHKGDILASINEIFSSRI